MIPLHHFAMRIIFTGCIGVFFCFGTTHRALCEETSPPVPSLADVVYKAGALTQRLATLKSTTGTAKDLQKLEQRLKRADSEVDRYHSSLGSLKDEDLQSYQQLATLKGEVREEAEAIRQVAQSLTETIRQVESRRREWLAEKRRWDSWRSQLEADMALKSVTDAFSRATMSIDEALDISSRELEPLLSVQQQSGDVATKISDLTKQIDAMMSQQRGETLRGGMPYMFSMAYLRQLIDLANEPKRLFNMRSYQEDRAFLVEKGWVIVLQTFIFVLMVSLIRRYRPHLLANTDRRFMAKRPYTLSLFVAVFTLSFLYGSAPPLWRAIFQTIAGVVAARLVAAFVGERWIKRAIYILILVMIGFQALLLTGVPLALMRLFLLVWCLAGILYFGWRARQGKATENRRHGSGCSGWSSWCLRSSSLPTSSASVISPSRSWTVPFGHRFCSSWDGRCSAWSAYSSRWGPNCCP